MYRQVNDHNTSNSAQLRWEAGVFFAMPMCYVAMFLIFGVVLDFPQAESVSDKIAYIGSLRINMMPIRQ